MWHYEEILMMHTIWIGSLGATLVRNRFKLVKALQLLVINLRFQLGQVQVVVVAPIWWVILWMVLVDLSNLVSALFLWAEKNISNTIIPMSKTAPRPCKSTVMKEPKKTVSQTKTTISKMREIPTAHKSNRKQPVWMASKRCSIPIIAIWMAIWQKLYFPCHPIREVKS